METKNRYTYAEKRKWILDRLNAKVEYSVRVNGAARRPVISATDEEEQEAWEKAFAGKVHTYTIGTNVSPDFARTLRRMYNAGDLQRGTAGNQDARRYGQKTYYVFYTVAKWPPQGSADGSQ